MLRNVLAGGCAAMAFAIVGAAVAQKAAPAAPAAPATAAAGETYARPKLAWGAPDLQGFWNNTSITSLQRPAGVNKLVLSEEEAKKVVNRNMLVVLSKQDAATNGQDPNNKDILKDKNADRGYNAFWIDPGTKMAMVKGEYRSSWIVDPPSGKIPYKPGARTGGTGYSPVNFDGPETRPLAERCIMSFSGSLGPVMLNGMYNNTFQIVQSPKSVAIDVEMIHDARIIPIVSGPSEVKHGKIPRWGGDSVGWYEGDTLVVETVLPHPLQRSFISDKGKVTERFTRWSKGQILYEFVVDDPTLYSQVWKGEQALNASEPVGEYACHEGNYAMHGILAGARKIEKAGGTPSMGPGIGAGIEIPVE